jgi:GAF domain-containing protein/anti-sigma regulatory factor (Ser/Thr protein kinase)
LAEHELYRTGEVAAGGDLIASGVRTVIWVALVKDGAAVGVFVIGRLEVRPFSDREIALLQNFAAQAVIAMENARLITETREALEQQTATAEVLGVINSSPGDLAPVFEALLEKAHDLCGATLGALVLYDGEHVRAAVTRGYPEAYATAARQGGPAHTVGAFDQLLRGERFVHIPDATKFTTSSPITRAAVEIAGVRTMLFVPLRKDSALLGYISAQRQEVRPFSDKQIALLQNFAAQAVIAMENARLITETREALEQQTATAEVLGVINSSPGDFTPVFDAILEKANTFCGAERGALIGYDGGTFRAVVTRGMPKAFDEFLRRGFPLMQGSPMDRLLRGEPVHMHDLRTAAAESPPELARMRRQAAEMAGTRTLLMVPLCREGVLLGYIAAYRIEVRPFTEKQIALLQNFAAQAVIAMENARLITETREALEQQTATAEVLGVINSSPGDLAPVFEAILEKAEILCDAVHGDLWTFDGERFHLIATHGEPGFADWLRRQGPFLAWPGCQMDRLTRDEDVIHVDDALEDPTFLDAPEFLAQIRIANVRTVLFVALRKDGTLLGNFVIYRREVRPFSEKQIALLQNFAAQAVIAMENARLITETREALEQQTATAEVLGVINSSPGDLAPVFDAMLEKAMRLGEAAFGMMHTYDGDQFHIAAMRNVPEAYIEYRRHNPLVIGRGTGPARILEGESPVHVVDLAAEDAYGVDRADRAVVDLAGARSILSVALRREDALLGMLTIYRQVVRPFSDKQIALLQNFAAQAVIAMENARLITETREALEQQTATAEVLGVINSSPGDLAPVFDAILEKARTLCGAAHGSLSLYDGEKFRAVAINTVSEELAARLREGFAGSDSPLLRPLLDGARLVHIRDLAQIDHPSARLAVELTGVHTALYIPLRKENALLGLIAAVRREIRPFSDKEIALVENFAAQAVIAMENARLITETREALEQQTATAEVLGVINASPGDLAPVFEAMLEKAMRLCEAAFGTLWTYDGDRFRSVAQHGVPAAYAEFLAHNAPAAGPGTGRARILQGERFVHVADLAGEEPYRAGDPHRRALVDLGGARTGLIMPLRKDEAVIGFIMIYRQEMRSFSEKQIALLQNFAAQAVIAMENARLITETREALEQQTATAEVLQVINSSPGDLTPVFDAILEKAHTLCGAAQGALVTYDGENLRALALRGVPEPFARVLREPFRPHPGNPVTALVRGERLVHVLDVAAIAAQASSDNAVPRAAAELGGVRTLLAVPLRKDDALLGLIVAYRQEVRPFSDKQIALLQNFATQAVIAMENARLITETRERTRDLQESLEYQTATSDVLTIISSSAFDLEPVLKTVVTSAIRLCRADHAGLYRNENGEYRWADGLAPSSDYEEHERTIAMQPGTGTLVGRVALEGRVVQIADAWTDPLYEAKDDARRGGVHTMLGVPLLREGAPIGVIGLARKRVELFTDKEIELVRTFADQAVIAMENARLLGELRERTDELGRSVEELKALAEVGQAVSSTLDLGAVLSTVLNRSVTLTEADAGVIFRYSQGRHAFRLAEAVGWEAALVAQVRDMHIDRNATLMGEAVTRRAPAQIADLRERPSNVLRDATLAAGYRSILIVPLVGADQIYGALLLQRRRPGEFPETAVRLMQTLAAQSVLAIQNARLFREIADKSEQLALASQHKSQFLANMSHELRTPLNAILGYAELLVDGIYGAVPERAMGVLERVQNNGRHLLALINDVLDLSKIEAGQLVLTLEDYALPDVVQSVVSATEGLASTKGLKLSATVAPGLPMGHGDARRLAQVLLNLVGNAVKFTDEGEVAIGALAEDGHFVLTVRDTGPGIAPEDQDKIFGEFQQVDNSNTRKKGGTGLGLAISKRMVEMQGGSITVESELGHGAIFRVALPIRVEEVADELTGELMGAA